MTVKRRRAILWAASLLATGLLAAGWWAMAAWRQRQAQIPVHWTSLTRPPCIRPDYGGAVIPANIAPLNFVVREPATAWYAQVEDEEGRSLAAPSSDGAIRFPLGPWKSLLAQNRGKRLALHVYARNEDRVWQRFLPLEWTVAQEDVDSHLVYRVLDAVYNVYKHQGLYQRSLGTFDEKPILFNSTFSRGCLNCHAFVNNRPTPLLFHVRPGLDSAISAGLIVARGDKAQRVTTRNTATRRPANVIAWHPSGDMAAFASTWLGQFMHGAGEEVREAFDLDSDMAVVDAHTGEVSSVPGLADPNRLETLPCWSPDGKYLYFSSAPRLRKLTRVSPLEDYRKMKYDLMRISYDKDAKAWGKPELLLAAAAMDKSFVEARTSPDGRYLLFCACDHGAFPVFCADSDLWLMDLRDRSYRRLAANSPFSESWHCWSSNSRWIVFSSKRDNGLMARPYFCYLDSSGQDHKPFLLPQSDPRFYDTCLKTYNLPEMIAGPLQVSEKELMRVVREKAADAAITPDPEASDVEGQTPSGMASP